MSWSFCVNFQKYQNFTRNLNVLFYDYFLESVTSSEKWKQLEEDEQKLEELKESLEKTEHEKGQINQDKVACKDKLEKGKRVQLIFLKTTKN